MELKDILKRTTLGDKVLICFLSLCTAASFPLLHANSKQGEWGAIEVNGELFLKVPLRENKAYTVQGYKYETLVEVKDGTIEIKDHQCPNPLLHSGGISRTGDIRVCVYNRAVVRIEGEDSRGVDVIAK